MFDYIIVGAGSVGCVMANRLSANPTTRVCLVDAGGHSWNPLTQVPLGLAILARIKSISWAYNTAPTNRIGRLVSLLASWQDVGWVQFNQRNDLSPWTPRRL